MAVCEQMKHVPELETMDSMDEGGYKFRLDGKIISLKQAKAFRENGKN